MASCTVTTLGGFSFKFGGVSTPGPPTRKARALMAFLVMNRGAATARERLLEIFWPEVEPSRARDSLITALSSIRACLRSLDATVDDFLIATNSIVRWTADSVVDAERFASLATRDNDASASRAAVRLYHGDFLEGDYDDWTVAERERLTTLYESVLAKAVRTSRDPEAARLLIARNPYAEEAYVALIETELEAGRNASAATLAADFRKALAEVGEEPSTAFEERFGHIKLRSLETPPSNLPRQTTSFVGRVAELNEIAALLEKSRLTTVVGAGGVGKTRVAVHAAAQSLHRFDNGVWFADLATIEGENAVVTEIASAFRVKSSGFSGLLEHVVAHIKHKRLLLVLDNCEHVVAEAARVVEAIIAACPQATVLATSRERLGAHGEQVYRVPSLALPSADTQTDPGDALKFGAVALFAARASASDAHFSLTRVNVAAVVEICRHLDGIALAIELAAARVTTLHVHELLERLRTEFRLLRGDDRTVHPRYQTMRAALDWSYEWLSEEEKTLFRRLGIFRGGWTLESIHGCGVDESLDEFALLDKLWPLVSKSLVAVDFRGRTQRYRLMEPVRQYALELLKEHGEYYTTALHHATYFVEFARREGKKYLQISDLEFVPAIEEEIDNIRAALEWALLHGNHPVLGAEIAASLYGFWFTQCYHEGLRLLEAAQAAITPEAYPALSATIAVGRIRACMQTDMMAAARIGDEALPSARSLGEGTALLRFLFLHGHSLVSVGRLDEAELLLNEALQVALRVGDTYRQWGVHMSLAKLHRRRGDLSRSRTCIAAMVEAYKLVDLAFDRNRYIVLAERAWLEQLDGHIDRALELAREAYEVTRAAKDLPGSVQTAYYLGALLLLSCDDLGARTHARSLLKLSTEELFAHGIPAALQLLAGVAVRRGLYDQGGRLLGFAEARFAEQTIRRNVWVEVEPEWFLGPIRDQVGAARLAELMVDGAAWSQDCAIEEALKV